MLTPRDYFNCRFETGNERFLVSKQLQPRTCARFLKALGDPERLRIVERLQSGPKNVSELALLLRDDLAKVSHHLKVLRQVGLVQPRKQGKFVVYVLHPDIFRRGQGGDCLDLGCCRLELGTS
jgi:ArsR family transcriptional regulator